MSDPATLEPRPPDGFIRPRAEGPVASMVADLIIGGPLASPGINTNADDASPEPADS